MNRKKKKMAVFLRKLVRWAALEVGGVAVSFSGSCCRAWTSASG